jgi:hypothetical protein
MRRISVQRARDLTSDRFSDEELRQLLDAAYTFAEVVCDAFLTSKSDDDDQVDALVEAGYSSATARGLVMRSREMIQ